MLNVTEISLLLGIEARFIEWREYSNEFIHRRKLSISNQGINIIIPIREVDYTFTRIY